MREVAFERFTEEQSMDFLRRGFEEVGARVGEEILEQAVRELGYQDG